MISSIIDMVLLAALAGTSAAVILMYRRLQRFDALQGEAAKEFARTSAALDRAREAIAELSADGGEMAVALATRLNEARMVMNDIDEATLRTRGAFEEAIVEAAAPRHASVVTLAPAPVVVATAPVAAPAVRPAPALVAPPPRTGPAVEAYGEAQGQVSAAIRIRNAARARIEAAKAKAANKPAVPAGSEPQRPAPHIVPLPERLAPKLHRAPEETDASLEERRSAAFALLKPRDEAEAKPWATPALEALTGRLTWNDLARAAQQAS